MLWFSLHEELIEFRNTAFLLVGIPDYHRLFTRAGCTWKFCKKKSEIYNIIEKCPDLNYVIPKITKKSLAIVAELY